MRTTLKAICISAFITLSAGTPANAFVGKLWKDVEREWNSCFSGGCDIIWRGNQAFDAGVRSKSRAMAEGVREVFEPAMEKLFSEQIRPLLHEIDLLVRNNMKASAEVVFSRLDQSVSTAFDRAETTIPEIANRVIADAVAQASREIDKQRKAVLADLRTVVKDLKCEIVITTSEEADTIVNKIIDTVSVDWPWKNISPCEEELENKPFIIGRDRKYFLTKCNVIESLGHETTVADLVHAYSNLAELAGRFQCASLTSARKRSICRRMAQV